MAKVLITPRSFGKYSKEAYRVLSAAGIEIIENPTQGIMTEEGLMALIQDVDGIIAGVDPLNGEVLKKGEKLKIISKYGVGTDNIDLTYCEKHKIKVSITQNANAAAVSDYAFALMLSVARRISEIDKGCRQNDWSKKIAIDVYGKKIGILGLGQIGKGVAKRAKGFQMTVYAYDVYKDAAYIEKNNINFVSVEEIFKECDFISLHLPLTEETKGLVDDKMLSLAKPNLVIVNTARGGIINEEHLYNALKANKIYGAGIDVFEHEPPKDSKLLTLQNVTVGSHCAASTVGAVDQMSLMAAENIVKTLKEEGII